MRTFIGLIAWCLVVYGPEPCRNPYSALGRWCLSASGNWVYRKQRLAYDAGSRAFRRGKPRGAPRLFDVERTSFWLDGWDDAASAASLHFNPNR